MSTSRVKPPSFFRTRIGFVMVITFVVAASALSWAWINRPDAGSGALEQARLDVERGARYRAMKHYLVHLEESPEDWAAHLEFSELMKPLDSSLALEHLQKIPSSAPEYAQAIFHIAHIAVVEQQDSLAEDALLKLGQVRPDDAGVALSLAELYFRTQRYSESLSWVQQAVKLQPDRAMTWLLLAEVFDHLRRPGEMLQPLRKAIELDSDLYPAHANLVFALQYAGALEEAESEARWCLERQPDDIRVRRWLAMILRDQGEYETALRQIRLAIEKAPQDVDSRIVEADLLLFQREAEAAYKALIPFYDDHSDRRDYLGSLARAAAMSGRREESRRYQQQIVELIEAIPDTLDPDSGAL
ncbi:MAG: tetratricopeptide repeat protein [Fuerstiella sp.]